MPITQAVTSRLHRHNLCLGIATRQQVLKDGLLLGFAVAQQGYIGHQPGFSHMSQTSQPTSRDQAQDQLELGSISISSC